MKKLALTFAIVLGIALGASAQNGVLADVAPTILHIMGLQQPQEMTGQCLISQSCKNLNILRISGKSPF